MVIHTQTHLFEGTHFSTLHIYRLQLTLLLISVTIPFIDVSSSDVAWVKVEISSNCEGTKILTPTLPQHTLLSISVTIFFTFMWGRQNTFSSAGPTGISLRKIWRSRTTACAKMADAQTALTSYLWHNLSHVSFRLTGRLIRLTEKSLSILANTVNQSWYVRIQKPRKDKPS